MAVSMNRNSFCNKSSGIYKAAWLNGALQKIAVVALLTSDVNY